MHGHDISPPVADVTTMAGSLPRPHDQSAPLMATFLEHHER
jgi:hypothetical protein